MNFELSDEQVLLREAAAGALSRVKTVEAARGALEDQVEALPDLWPLARDAGWPGLLVPESCGGAGLGGLDAMLVHVELGRVLASVPLLGHVIATAVLAADADAHAELLAQLASGERRAALVPARPPDDLESDWTVEATRGRRREPAPGIAGDAVSGFTPWVIDAPGADVLVVVGVRDGEPGALVVEASDAGVEVEHVTRFDATRSLGHVTLDGAGGQPVAAGADEIARGWYLAQGLLAGEALGAVEEALKRSVEYAKERYTFGRAIGSYQAVKHNLVEVLRRGDNLRSLIYYAGWASDSKADELAVAASAARVAADEAIDFAARQFISVHGGIGATWEHDAPFYFRRAELSRRLLGGAGDAAGRVAAELFAQSAAQSAAAAPAEL